MDNKNCWFQWDSNSDCRKSRRAFWPFDHHQHHHVIKILSRASCSIKMMSPACIYHWQRPERVKNDLSSLKSATCVDDTHRPLVHADDDDASQIYFQWGGGGKEASLLIITWRDLSMSSHVGRLKGFDF